MPHLHPTQAVPLARPFAPSLPARRTLAALAGTLLIALCAHVAVPLPFTPVPMTLQPFAVVLLGLLMGPSLGAATAAAYLLEGAAGLPVFTSSGPVGLLHLVGPTGGYLLSYPAAAAVAGYLGRGRTLLHTFAGALAANALILVCGACWLASLTHLPAAAVMHQAVLPFAAEDGVKIALAALLAAGWHRARFDRAHSGPAS